MTSVACSLMPQHAVSYDFLVVFSVVGFREKKLLDFQVQN
jgi:hypothetical protein